MNTVSNWYMTWELVQDRNRELLASVDRRRLVLRQQTPYVHWPRRVALILALLGMR